MLLSLKVGPSVKIGLSPFPSTVVAVVAGSKPSAKTKWPSRSSISLNAPVSANASSIASLEG